MNVRGVGTDLCEVRRVADLLARHGDRFLARCFRPGEIPVGRRTDPATVASRWAAKEAVFKALGGYVGGIPYRDVEITGGGDRRPGVRLHGAALALHRRAGGGTIHLSLSHERDHALAFALVEG